jgi:hypothetical protein
MTNAWRRVLLLVPLMVLGTSLVPLAHDIPLDVRIVAFLKPEGERLHLLARVPMRAMRDIEFPLTSAGTLDTRRAQAALRTAATQWILNSIELYEGGARLSQRHIRQVRVSLPADSSFDTFDNALVHVRGDALPAGVDLPWDQGMLDVWIEYPIRSEHSEFAIRPGFERLGVRVVTGLRVVLPGGVVRPFELIGDPGIVRLDPRWHQAALRFVALGFGHILDGTDHLLFLLCLVIPFRRLKPLVVIVTAFTVAHSVTLMAAAFDLAPGALWFPPLIETLIAASIVYMALENIVSPGSAARRWAIAFGFGLVHGFGFSFALRETLQFAGSHLLTSLLAFNIGVELGQLLVLVVLVPALQLAFRFAVAERMGTIILSALVAHTGWHWMTERWDQLTQYEGPTLDPMFLVAAGRVAIVLVLLGGIAWWVSLRARSVRGFRRPA